MKKRIVHLLIICLIIPFIFLSCGRRIGAENFLLLVPKDTRALVSINMSKISKTNLYQNLLKDEARLAEYNRFIADTGIDPLRDLTKMIVIIPLDYEKNKQSVSIGFGKIDQEKIIENLKKKGELTESYYLKLKIYQFEIDDRKVNICFLGEEAIASGGMTALHQIIKVFKKKEPTVRKNRELMELIDRINQADTIWAVALMSPDWKKKLASFPLTLPFSSLNSFLFSIDTVNEEIRLVMVGKAETGARAKEIANTLSGLRGLAVMGLEGKLALSDFLTKIDIESVEEFITLSLNTTEEEIDLAKAELSGQIKNFTEENATIPKLKQR
jgi:hypothetical protein